MKIIAKLSYSEKLRFPDRILYHNDSLKLIAKNEYDCYALDSSDNMQKKESVTFPAFEEIFLSEFTHESKHVFITKTDRAINVYNLNEYGYLEEINKIKLDEDNITVFVSDDQVFVVVYNVHELIVYNAVELVNREAKPYKLLELGDKCAILQLIITQNVIYGLLNIEKSPYLGRVDLLQGDIDQEAFELKLLNYKAGEIAVCGERLCVYADDESNDLYIYKIADLFNGKTSIDTELFKDKKIYVSQAVKLFQFSDISIGILQANNRITLVDTSKFKRIAKFEFDHHMDIDISEIVDVIHIGSKRLVIKTLNELLLYDIDNSDIKTLAKFKDVYEEVIDLSL